MLTSHGIERKLPTLGKQPFSETTCDRLLDLLLRECSTMPVVDPIELIQVVGQDPAFAKWLETNQPFISLADALVQHNAWRDESAPSNRLWHMAHISIRLRTLERHFVDALALQKREAIYHFAYGLSHELNNPLANIATRAGVLAHREQSAENRALLESIIDNAMRGSEMLGDLMLVARPPTLQPRAVDVAQWFQSFAQRCESWAAKRNLHFNTQRAIITETAAWDAVAVTEAAWCLVRNAFEASNTNGNVEIRLDEVGDEHRLAVLDQGPGLSAHALEHCFDPYFSGREAGRGLGLGLCKAQMIATAHGGTLKLCNRPAGGCEAVMTLPIVSSCADSRPH